MELASKKAIMHIRVSRGKKKKKKKKKRRKNSAFIYLSLCFERQKKNILLPAQCLRSKWAVSKAGDPTTERGDKTVTSGGKEIRQHWPC